MEEFESQEGSSNLVFLFNIGHEMKECAGVAKEKQGEVSVELITWATLACS